MRHELEVYPVDHMISWAMYFSDPDGNGLEIYTDNRAAKEGRAAWHGENRPLSQETILAARNAEEK